MDKMASRSGSGRQITYNLNDADSQQLTYQFMNAAANPQGEQNIVYISDDISYNKIEFQITLNVNTVEINPGEIVDPSIAPPVTGSVIYLDLSSLQIAADLFNKINVNNNNWDFKLFANENTIGFSPKETITLAAGKENCLSLSLENIQVVQALAKPIVSLNVMAFNITGIDTFGGFNVSVVEQPSGKDKSLPDFIDVQINPATIISSYSPATVQKNFNVENSINLIFAPGEKQAQVLAGTKTTFTVSFQYGKDAFGYGALTSVTNALEITTEAGSNAHDWIITKNSDQETVTWTLQPPSGSPILNNGQTVEITFNNIYTTYQAGPTVMLIAYENIPGFQSGAYAKVLEKIPHVCIESFSVAPIPLVFQGKTAKAQISWNVDHFTQLTLKQNFLSIDITDKISPIEIDVTSLETQFTLSANGVFADLDNVDYASITVQALPHINSFYAKPSLIFSGQSSQQVQFQWAVDTAAGQKVVLTSTGGAFSGVSYPPSESVSANVTQAQVVTMAPDSADDDYTLLRNLNLYAFTPKANNYSLNSTTNGVAASPTAPFLVFSNMSANQILVVDSVNFSVMQTVNAGNKPNRLVFSQDGTLLIVCNTGDNSLSIYNVNYSSGNPVISISQTISLDAIPSDVMIAFDNSHIYVSQDYGNSQPGKVISLAKSKSQFQLDSSVAVGISPQGICAMLSGGQIYVANKNSNNVSVIPLDKDGKLSPFNITAIDSVGDSPVDVTLSDDGSLLLVCCQGSGQIVVIDTQNPNTGQRSNISVGKSPSSIELSPAGGYAIVANSGDATISLINCSGTVNDVTLVGSSIQVSSNPMQAAFSPDGSLVMVTSQSTNQFTLVSLNSYEVEPQNIDFQSIAINNVAASTDGKIIYCWSTILNQPLGLYSYNVKTGNISGILNDKKVLNCIFSTNQNFAYAIVQNDTTVYEIDQTTQTPQAINFDRGISGAYLLSQCISGDGKTFFFCVKDGAGNISLYVASKTNSTFKVLQTISLGKQNVPGNVLLGATLDASAVFAADIGNQIIYAVKNINSSYTVAKTITSQYSPQALTILPDGSKVILVNATTANQNFTLIDIPTLSSSQVNINQAYIRLSSLVCSPDGRRLYATDQNAGAVRIIDTDSLRMIQTIVLTTNGGIAQQPSSLAILPDASRIFIANTMSANMSILNQIQMKGV